MKRILPFLWALLLLATPATIKAQLTYTTNDGAITITGYIGSNPVGLLAIPASTNGLPVTDIAPLAFAYATNLTSVTIPDSVVNIESNAFEECTSLTNVAITNGVAIVGQEAFYGCGSLASLILPVSVTNVGPYAFFECSNLTSVTNSNASANIGNFAFAYCISLASATIPGGLTNAVYAFDACPNLTSIAITDGSTNIATEEFAYYFTNLVRVTIPNSVTTIGSNAFEECFSLANLTIPDSVATIESNAFAYCTGLTNLTIANGPTFMDIGPQAFLSCTRLTSVEIPASVTHLGDAAFLGCSHLASVTISNASASLGDGVFQYCSNIVSATIPGDVASAYDEFYGVANPISVTLSAGSTYVAVGEFAYFTNMTEITLPNSVANIQSNAFYECTGLNNVTIPANVTNIGSEAFLGCSNLASVVVDGSLAAIGYAAFVDCPKLASVTIQGSVTNMAESAFQLCTNLNRLTIVGSVGSVEAQAFYGCSNLVGVAIYGGASSIGQFAFVGCVKLTSVVLGGNAPNVSTNGPYVFYYDRMATVYHFAGTTGWSNSFAGLRDTALKVPSGLLYVFINGNGKISPNDNGAVLTFGKPYILTAAPASQDYIFFNWTGGTNAGSTTVLSTNASYKLMMESNLTLQANFVTNLFLAAQGSYNGLFAVTNDNVRQQTNSGSFTLKVTSSGSLSGDLFLGSATPLAFSGKFGPNGVATNTIKRHNASTLTSVLTLDVANQTVTGTVTDGSFVAQLRGNQAVFSSKNKAPFAGQYTVVIPGTTNAAIGPNGTSYGTVTVSPLGVITFAGSLADGTSVSQTSFVSQDGAWPFYLPLYGGNGSIFSWIYFTTNGVFTYNSSWINAGNSSATAAYKAGFTNNAVSIYGSAYTATPLDLPDGMGEVLLEGGGLALAPSVTNYVSLGANDKVTVTTNVNKMVLMINKANGLISGTFANDAKTIKVNGVLFQSETNALGFFLGPDQTSGTFTLMAQ